MRSSAHFPANKEQQGKTSMGVVKNLHVRPDRRPQPDAVGALRFPERPSSRILSQSIPLYFIARNKNGFWVVREAAGRCCGVFLFRRSALRFARKSSAPAGCATMLLTERFEPDVHGQANSLFGWIHSALHTAASHLSADLLPHTAATAASRSHVEGARR
jgi:hypothetical protein